MTRPNARLLTAPAAVLLALLVPATVVAISPDWTRHMGTKAEEAAGGIAADGSGLTIVGTTGGNITHKVKGGSDAFIRRYDRHGQVLWTRQFGTDAQDMGQDVAADGGGLTVLGSTDGSFSADRAERSASTTCSCAATTATATKHWTRQFGTSSRRGPGRDRCRRRRAVRRRDDRRGADRHQRARTTPTPSSAATTAPGTSSGRASSARTMATRRTRSPSTAPA